MTYGEKETLNYIKFHCDKLIDFNSKIEVRSLKVYKNKRKKNLLKFTNSFLYFTDNDWLNHKENSLNIFLISDLITKKIFIAVIENQYFANDLKEEKLILFYETTKFWKKLLISKYNSIATNY